MKITADRVKAAEKVLADNGIEEDETQSVMQAVGYALADVELYPAPEYGPLDWLMDAAKARDAARDYVERIWNAWLREDDIESFCDYWIVGGKIRVSYEWRGSPDPETQRRWREYPASIFASETDADKRAAEWRKNKDTDDKEAFEELQRQWREKTRQNELTELKRLKEKYEKSGETQAAGGA